MISLDAATVLLQWAVGGALLAVGHDPAARGRPRLRLAARAASSAALAIGSLVVGVAFDTVCGARGRDRRRDHRDRRALAVSVARRRAGVAGQRGRARSSIRSRCRDDRHRPRRGRGRHGRSHRAGVPARARSRGAGHRPGRAGRGGHRRRRAGRRWPSPARLVGAAFLGVGHRRDAPRPLVPRAARPVPRRRCSSSCAGSAVDLARRGRRAHAVPTGMVSVLAAPSTTAATACSAGSGWPAR